MDTLSGAINIVAFIYVVLPLLFLIVLALYVRLKGPLLPATTSALLDFGKWYMLSVAVVFLGKMLESTFTERETGIKEIAVFDKYTNVILKNDSLEEKWALASYFATVTPTVRLRERWVAYQEVIRPDHLKFLELQQSKLQIKNAPDLNDSQKTLKIQAITDQQSELTRKYVTSPSLKTTDAEAAKAWERKGFEALLSKNLGLAQSAFSQSEESYNGYHMSYELSNYLRNYKSGANGPDWKEIYARVLALCAKFKGSIPDDIAQQMQNSSN